VKKCKKIFIKPQRIIKFVIEMYVLDTRSLIEIRGSLLVTLPISWVRHNALTKGQRVDVALDDNGRLVITPIEKEQKTAAGSVPASPIPARGAHQTPLGADVNGT